MILGINKVSHCRGVKRKADSYRKGTFSGGWKRRNI